MTDFEVYKTYLAFKNHFTKKTYDYHKYCGRSRASKESFYKRKDRYFFERISRQKNDEQIKEYFVSNFVDFGNDLCLMTMASAVIAANSSFSWWGAWLSQADLICAPKLWFGSELAHLSTKDLIPEHWARIE